MTHCKSNKNGDINETLSRKRMGHLVLFYFISLAFEVGVC